MSEELPLPQEDINNKKETQPKNIWKILTIIFGILLVVLYIQPFSGDISKDEAKTIAITQINSILQGRAVAEVDEVSEENNLYKLKINIAGETMDSYITKDGSLLFPTAIDLTAPVPDISGATTQQPQEIPKLRTPEVKLFVMSQCPFGTIAEGAMKPVLELLGDKIDYKLFFIANEMPDGTFQSLHDQPEVDGNIRQLCVIKYYPKTYTDYIACVNENYQSLPWESCLEKNSMDKDKIETCWKGDEGKGLLSENIKEAPKYQASGSPTLVINEVKYQGQRTPEAYKQTICNAFETPPTECEEVLEVQTAQASGSC